MDKTSFVLSVSTGTCADRRVTQQRAPAVITLPDLLLTEGNNRIALPANKGCMEFVKRGDQFSELVITDPAGYATHFAPHPGDFPLFSCVTIIPDACFGLPDSGETALCFCKTAGAYGETYTVTFRKAVLYAL